MRVALVSFVLRDGHAAARGFPQLPRATRSPEFPSEHLLSFMDFRWSTRCLGARQAEAL